MSWLAAFRSLQLAASLLLGGAIAFELLVLRRAAEAVRAPELVEQVRRWLRTQGALGVVLGLFSWAAWLAAVTIGMTGLPASEALVPENLGLVATRTTFGHVWVLRCILFLLLAIPLLSAQAGRLRAARWLSGCAATVLLASLAWTGHAVASGAAHLAVDAAHVCAAAVWVGMLPPLGLLLLRACASGDAGCVRLAAATARLFSPPAIAAVLTLVVTGSLSAWWLVGTPGRLLDTSYGLLLSSKLALFAGMLGFAACNRLLLTPRLASAQPATAPSVRAMRLLGWNVLAEIALAAALLGVVGTLGVTPPATHEAPAHQHHHDD